MHTFTEVAKAFTEVAKAFTEVAKAFTEVAKAFTEVTKTFTEVTKTFTEVTKTFTEVTKTFTEVEKHIARVRAAQAAGATAAPAPGAGVCTPVPNVMLPHVKRLVPMPPWCPLLAAAAGLIYLPADARARFRRALQRSGVDYVCRSGRKAAGYRRPGTGRGLHPRPPI
ncbi:MAG: hypothetical protein U0074_13635 [Kouleothrix sp.]